MKVYYINTSEFGSSKYERLFSYADENRRERFFKNKDISRLAAGALLTVAFKDCGIDYPGEEKVLNKNGKESFKHLNVKYNISHSGTMCVCAIYNDEIGVDCEDVKDKDNCLNVAKRFFTHDEYRHIFSSDNKADEFTKIWTIKEAYIKYTGKGFEIPLKSFECIPDKDEVKINDASVKTYKILNTYVSVCAKTEKFPDKLTDMTQFFLQSC